MAVCSTTLRVIAGRSTPGWTSTAMSTAAAAITGT
jgi:hypothetical protein